MVLLCNNDCDVSEIYVDLSFIQSASNLKNFYQVIIKTN